MSKLPRILVIDDVCGRLLDSGHNEEREDLCGKFRLVDATGDQEVDWFPKEPLAEAIFCRGQRSVRAVRGQLVENDVEGTVQRVADGQEAGSFGRWALVLIDLCFHTGRVTAASEREKGRGMPEGRSGEDEPQGYFGLTLLRVLRDRFPGLPVMVLSSMPREPVSLDFATLGALGFLSRDEDDWHRLRDLLLRHGLVPDPDGVLLGSSRPLLAALRAARRASSSGHNILLRGEKGTGKDLLARYIHRISSTPRSEGPFVEVNCGGLTPTLFASELFGHRRGAFTGADRNRDGHILRAHGGDLFLDEVGYMPLEVQMGLQRAVEYRSVSPLGDEAGSKIVDTRFLSATNVDIEALAQQDRFRPDLLDKLRAGGTVRLPPLRERKEDIPELVRAFVRAAESQAPGSLQREIAKDALDQLIAWDWPGNVRELAACIRKAVHDYPDVEHLVAAHLDVPRANTAVAAESQAVTANGPARDEAASAGHEAWRGRIADVLKEQARTRARLLQLALEETREPTGQRRVVPTFAIRWLTGEAIESTAVYDWIRRLLSDLPREDLREFPELDTLLRKASEKRRRGRGR